MCRQRTELRRCRMGVLAFALLAFCGKLEAKQGLGGPTTSPMPVTSGGFPQNWPQGDPAYQSPAPLTNLEPVPRTTAPLPNGFPPNGSPPPSVSLGAPMFDPYNSGANPGVYQPAIPGQPAITPGAAYPGGASLGSIFGNMMGNPASFPASPPPVNFGAPNGPNGSSYTVAPPPPANSYPSSIYPQSTPPVLYPGGVNGTGYGGTSSGGNYYNPFTDIAMPAATKFLQGPRVQYAFLGGGNAPSDLGINELETSIAFAFPNFLWSGQPIYVLPSFSLDLWDGPSNLAADLPGQAYEGFLDFGWQTNPNNIFGLETGLRVGVFTDFDTMNTDSLRILGQLIGKFRLSPRATLKAGVMYIDRNEIQLLPAGGLLWQPSPYSRLDIYFPEPKISTYLRTVGTQDVWGYLGGEFGGGSWTITRADGAEDSIDINDIRVMLGLEWGRSDLIRSGRRTGFAEAGVVFNREVIYANDPTDNFDPPTTFIFRIGFGY